jgi:hypothetical protein
MIWQGYTSSLSISVKLAAQNPFVCIEILCLGCSARTNEYVSWIGKIRIFTKDAPNNQNANLLFHVDSNRNFHRRRRSSVGQFKSLGMKKKC